MEPEVSITTIYKALSKIADVDLRTVYRRAEIERWHGREVRARGRGGKRLAYLSSLLPADVRAALADFAPPAVRTDTLPTLEAKKDMALDSEQEKKAYAKFELAKAYVARLAESGHGNKEQARKTFIDAYNLGEAGIFPAVFRLVGAVDPGGRTIHGWVTRLKKHQWNPICLVDRRGYAGKGKRAVTVDQMQIILSIVQSPYNVPDKPVQEIIRQAKMVMEKRNIDTLSDSTYRRWLVNDWIPNNYDQWIWWREGDKGLNDKVLFDLTRDADRIDAGDLLVADGHVLNFEVISPVTRRPKRMMLVMFTDFKSNYPLGWEIADTENTQAISIALRRAILRLGKIPKAVYIDNGRAFKGGYFLKDEGDALELKGVYKRIGIEHIIIALAYHGQSKPIERTFGVFGEMERLALSYVGSSIQNKPAHLNRGEKLRVQLHHKITRGVTPSLEEAHRAVAFWCDEYVNRPMGPSSKFPGRTPDELMIPGPGVDPVLLRCLMAKTEERLIHQRGVNIDGQWYYHPALYGKKFKVYCRRDFLYEDSVLVYEQSTNEFICEAFRVKKVHPMVSIMGTEADKAEYQRQMEMKYAGRKLTIASAKEIIETQVLPEAQQRIEAAGFALDGGHAAGTKALPQPLPVVDEKQVEKDLAALECISEDDTGLAFSCLKDLPELDRFEKLLEYETRGWLIPEEHKAWMSYFEKTQDYERHQEYFEQHKAKMALMYGT